VNTERDKERNMAVLFGGGDSRETATVSSLVRTLGYALQCKCSYAELEAQLQVTAFGAVIMDIDSLAVDNRSIRHLASAYPHTPILCISKNRLHPELSESLQNHIFACLTKPVDQDELGYWLHCIRKDSRCIPR
jgi:DNA-binding NtrC family response regulator